jgi:hypothetical protein
VGIWATDSPVAGAKPGGNLRRLVVVLLLLLLLLLLLACRSGGCLGVRRIFARAMLPNGTSTIHDYIGNVWISIGIATT